MQAKQQHTEEHGYESCLRRQAAHYHRRGRAADACCNCRQQNRACSSREWPWHAARQLGESGTRREAIHSGARRRYGILGTAIVAWTRGGTPVRVGVFVDVYMGAEDARAVKPLERPGRTPYVRARAYEVFSACVQRPLACVQRPDGEVGTPDSDPWLGGCVTGAVRVRALRLHAARRASARATRGDGTTSTCICYPGRGPFRG